LEIAEQTVVGRITGGHVVGLTPTQIRTLINVADGANAYVHPNHSGDVTSVADGAQTIATAAVSLAKMADLAQDKIIGRATASTGVPEAITCTAAGRALLDDASAADQRTTLGVGTGDSPVFVTAKLSGLTDGYVPYHASDASGLADSKLFWDAANRRLGIGLDYTGTSPQKALDISGDINITQVVCPPNTYTLTGTTGGGLDDGAVYHYAIAFVTANGDTDVYGDTSKDITLAVGQNAVEITNIPVSVDPRVTGRRIYRSIGGGNVATGGSILINNNTDTSYTDLIADGSLSTSYGTMYRKDNLTMRGIYVNNILMAKLGKWNMGVGNDVLGHVTFGFGNFAFGKESLHGITTGTENIGVGSSAFGNITTGSWNVGVGYSVGSYNQAGERNTAVGANACRMVSWGSSHYNSGFGNNALCNIANGNNYNSGFGHYAGFNVQANYGIFLGAYAGYQSSAVALGDYNIFLGVYAGDNATTGAYGNVLIGKLIDLPIAGGNRQLSIGNLIYGTLLGQDSTVSDGNVGVAIASPTARLHLPACAAAADKASLKIDAGTLASTPVSGNIESDGTHLYWTDSGGTRRQLDN
jgi:hypothetical protein